MLLEELKTKAVDMGLMNPVDKMDAERAFLLVRDMPYTRASSRAPETLIAEWRGTCSGKHYLLKALFAELGISSRLIACTSVAHLDPEKYEGRMRALLIEANGRFVDVHNYLMLELPDGEMIVDATWPIYARGTVINENFVLGENQKIAAKPIQKWIVPGDGDPQKFKDFLLRENFTPLELEQRDEFIKLISAMFKSALHPSHLIALA